MGGWLIAGLVFVGLVGLVVGVVMLAERDAKKKQRTLERGEPVIGWLVQANSDLFRPGSMDLPAVVLISPDEETAGDEEFMTDLAARIMELKGVRGRDRDERFVSRLVTDEAYVEGKRERIPGSFAGDREVYAADAMIYREHLPGGKLEGQMLHLAVIWDEPGSLICTRPAPAPRRKGRERDDEDY